MTVDKGLFTKFQVDMPREPRSRSVVLDRNRDAWQRRDLGFWFSAEELGLPKKWTHLVADLGPLVLLYDGAGD